MDLIGGLLAFALTMVVISVAVTSMVESLQRLLRWRQQGLADAMALLARELSFALPESNSRQALRTRLEAIFADAIYIPLMSRYEGERTRSIAMDAHFDAPPEGGWSALRGALRRLPRWLRRWRALGEMREDVEREELIRQTLQHADWLAAATAARKLVATLDLAARVGPEFDAVMRAAKEKFARRAAFWSIVAGVGLALAANIDAFHLLRTYLTDPSLRAAVIARYDEIAKQTNAAATPVPADAPPPAADAPAREVGSIRREIAALGGQGFPIGGDYFPVCAAEPVADTRCERTPPTCTDPGCVLDRLWSGTGATWLIGTLFTGFLAGLGSPFWFRLAKDLAAVRGR